MVLAEDGIVLGVVRAGARALDVDVVEAMDPGPATVRPSIDRWELADSMDADGQDHVLVTTLDGRFVGVLTRDALRG